MYPHRFLLTAVTRYKLDRGCDDDSNCKVSPVAIFYIILSFTSLMYTYRKYMNWRCTSMHCVERVLTAYPAQYRALSISECDFYPTHNEATGRHLHIQSNLLLWTLDTSIIRTVSCGPL